MTAGPAEHSGKAVLIALAIAGTYWTARQEAYRRMPVHETRPATRAERGAIDARITSPQPLHEITGWSVAYRPLPGHITHPDGSVTPLMALDSLGRFREDRWLRRDVFMALLRSLGFLACLAAMWRLGGLGAWRFEGCVTATGAGFAVAAGAGILLSFLGGTERPLYGSISWPLMAVLNLPVGFFEETCFRGLLFTGLTGLMSLRRAALLSSLIFTVWHWGAQDVEAFPSIFLYGISACAALASGLGLPWLAASHAAVDTLVLKTMTIEGVTSWLHGLAAGVACAAWGWRRLKETLKAAC